MKKIICLLLLFFIIKESYCQDCTLDSNKIKLLFKDHVIRIELKNNIGKQYLIRTFNSDQKKLILKNTDLFTFYDLYIDSTYFTVVKVQIKKRKLDTIKKTNGLLKDKNILTYKLKQCNNDIIFIYSANDQYEIINKILICF